MVATIIVCGIISLGIILFGLRLLRKHKLNYDAKKEKAIQVSKLERMATAPKREMAYKTGRRRILLFIFISISAVVLIGVGIAFGSKVINNMKAEREQAKVEKNEEDANKGLFYYFSYDANLERYKEHRKEVYNEILFSIQETEEKIQKAKASGDKSEEMAQEALLEKLKDNLNKAKEETKRELSGFDCDWLDEIGLYIFGSVVLVLLSFGVVYAEPFVKSLFIVFSLVINAGFGIASIFIEGVSWAVLIFWIVMIVNLFLVCKNWKKADWDR